MADVPSFDRFFIGGEWVKPSSSETFTVVSPFTEEVVGHRAGRAGGRHRRRRRRGPRRASTTGPWARMSGVERADAMRGLLRRLHRPVERPGRADHRRDGRPAAVQPPRPDRRRRHGARLLLQPHQEYAFEEVRAGFLGPAVVRKEPVGVVAGIIPWNVPLFITMLKMGPALASGSSIVLKPAPETPISALGPGPARRGGRHPRRCRQRRPGRPWAGRAPRHAPRRRQGQLHRFDGRRPQDRRALRREPEALHARARRQVGRHHPRRRRPRRLDPRAVRLRHHEQRPGLRRADPHPRQPLPATTRSSRRSPRRPRPPSSATRPTWTRASARSSPSASAIGSRATSPRARPKAPASPPAAAARPASTRAGSSSRRSSPTSPTR